MSSATLNIKVSPRRMLTLREAADYVGLPPKRFPSECGVSPLELAGGRRVYDMHDLDRWIDALKDGAGDGDESILARLG